MYTYIYIHLMVHTTFYTMFDFIHILHIQRCRSETRAARRGATHCVTSASPRRAKTWSRQAEDNTIRVARRHGPGCCNLPP